MRYCGYINIPVTGRYAFDLYIGKENHYLESPQCGWKNNMLNHVCNLNAAAYGTYPNRYKDKISYVEHRKQLMNLFNINNNVFNEYKLRSFLIKSKLDPNTIIFDYFYESIYCKELKKDIFIDLVASIIPECEHELFQPAQNINAGDDSVIESFRLTESMCKYCGFV